MEEISQLVKGLIQKLFAVDMDVVLTRPEEQFGDYATNVALQLAQKLGRKPPEIADEIAAGLTHESIAKTEVAGPGFINITLTDTTLIVQTQAMNQKTLQDKVILVEYSDPNPFKPLHAGHLYTTLVGDTIARLIANAGATTHRINYGGDVGLHVGKSMWAIIKHLGGETPEKLQDVGDQPAWLGERYVEGNNAYEVNETAKQEIIDCNRRVYELHAKNDHDSPFAQIYWTCRQWSYDYFNTLYQQLQVVPFDRFIPESEVTQLGLNTVKEQLQKGVFKESDGAVVFEGEKYGLHTRVFINSQGLPTYETKDVGLSLTKWQDYHFDRSIIITANEQDQYMKVVIKSIEQIEPEAAKRTTHITHGVVKLQGGVKMSSRKGNIITALEIIDAARSAGVATGSKPNEETILAAIKYAFAKNRIGGDIVYDPAESIALEGNSGPYLQYAHARACSILARASGSPRIPGEQLSSDAQRTNPYVSASVLAAHPGLHDAAESLNNQSLEPGERTLVRKLSMYAETIEQATAELMPHHVCTYLYELAQEFNRFYEHNQVIGDAREATRIGLVARYIETLKNGLELLGIFAPEQM